MDWEDVPFDLIADSSVFGARKWAGDHFVRVSDPDDCPSKFNDLDGRHKFWMHPTGILTDGDSVREDFDPNTNLSQRLYSVLRFDPENLTVSGDLFADISRRRWIYSWTSEAIFTITRPPDLEAGTWQDLGWDLLIIADVHAPRNANGTDGPHSKMALAVRTNAENPAQLEAVRAIRFGDGSDLFEDLSLSDPRRGKSGSFRRMDLVNVINTSGENAEIYRTIINAAFGENGTELHQPLQGTGARIWWRNQDDQSVQPANQDIGTTELELLAPYQWTENPYRFAVLITTIQSDRRQGLLGVVPGLNGEYPMHKSRFGAIVHARSIIDGYLSYDGRGGLENYQEHMDGLKDRLRHYYIHELGHLMNLPHPWQRDRFREPSILANPAAVSAMNYGSRYPLGQFMEVSRKHLAGNDAAALAMLHKADSERSLLSDLKDPIFSPAEQLWVRHAPFHQVTPGGPYFTEPGTEQLSLQAPSVESGRQLLNMKLWDASPAQDGYAQLPILKHGDEKRWYLSGDITLKVPKDFLKDHFLTFTFQSPMLTLLVRSEFPDGDQPDAIRKIGVAPIVALPFDVELEDPEAVSNPSEDWLAELIAGEAGVFQVEDDFAQSVRYLPLINQDFFRSVDPKARCFTLQALLRTDPRPAENIGDTKSSQRIYSNQLRVCFRDAEVNLDEEAMALLNDENLPLLLEMLTHAIPGHSIKHVKLPSKHIPDATEAIYAELADTIERLDIDGLAFGKSLFGRMQFLLRSLATLDKYVREGTVPALPQRSQFEIYHEEFQRFLSADPDRLSFFRERILPRIPTEEVL